MEIRAARAIAMQSYALQPTAKLAVTYL